MTFHPVTPTIGNITPPLPVADGGTGQITFTADELLASGTTATGAFQQIGQGTAGQVLTSAGAGALPAFASIPTWTPSDQGFLGWVYDPVSASDASNAPTSGVVVAVKIKVPATTITNLWVGINSAGTSLTSGQNFAGLYDSTGATLLSATADQTTNWTNTSFAALSMALTTPQAVPAGYVYVAWFANNSAGSNPKFQWNGSSNHVNANLANATARFAHGGTGATTALPASLTLTTSGDTYWAGVN